MSALERKLIKSKYFILMLILFLNLISNETEQALSSDIETKTNSSRKILSRRKRYLTFPEGSSLQLVYCLTVPVIGYATIFTMGGTASLAWELPHEPYHRHKIIDGMLKRIDNSDSDTSGGWLVQKTMEDRVSQEKVPDYNPFLRQYPPSVIYNKFKYKKEPSLNSPAYRNFIKRKYAYESVENSHKNKYFHYSFKPQQTIQNNYKWNREFNDPEVMHFEKINHHIHRRTRRDLYIKIIDFFRALSKDGKACLMKSICEVSQTQKGEVDSFMHEILKAIFRYKPHDNYENEDEYDIAYNKSHNCIDRYPTCTTSIWNIF